MLFSHSLSLAIVCLLALSESWNQTNLNNWGVKLAKEILVCFVKPWHLSVARRWREVERGDLVHSQRSFPLIPLLPLSDLSLQTKGTLLECCWLFLKLHSGGRQIDMAYKLQTIYWILKLRLSKDASFLIPPSQLECCTVRLRCSIHTCL